jgi:flagellar hook-basal body complex protein FliE
MRIDDLGFSITGPFSSKESQKGKGLDFVESLKEAINAANTMAKESERAALDLSMGKTANIHETMIAMQKTDIMLRLLVNMTSKLIDGYNELNRLR